MVPPITLIVTNLKEQVYIINMKIRATVNFHLEFRFLKITELSLFIVYKI